MLMLFRPLCRRFWRILCFFFVFFGFLFFCGRFANMCRECKISQSLTVATVVAIRSTGGIENDRTAIARTTVGTSRGVALRCYDSERAAIPQYTSNTTRGALGQKRRAVLALLDREFANEPQQKKMICLIQGYGLGSSASTAERFTASPLLASLSARLFPAISLTHKHLFFRKHHLHKLFLDSFWSVAITVAVDGSLASKNIPGKASGR